MVDDRIDYNTMAETYDRRYAANAMEPIAEALRNLAVQLKARCVLEAGCGTGHWLTEMRTVAHAFGTDRSLNMLHQASRKHPWKMLACATADRLPFPDACFDMVYCVNALHHFPDQRAFVHAARRVLAPGGALAVVGLDPHAGTDRWHVYDYFPETHAADLRRYPSCATLRTWMAETGLGAEGPQTVARVRTEHRGRAVMNDPFLEKSATSQLALLSDEAYAAGMQRIEEALAEAEAMGRQITFSVDLSTVMLVGHLR